ncbi:MAG: exodeoxyribonuclease VII small subunit [Saprospiraceae bacterium]
MNYTEALEELQIIVAELQSDSVNMDDLAAKTKRAAELIQFCQQKLRTTEEEVGKLFE